MSQPLFSTEGSVWRTTPYTVNDDEDEQWVDQSLPSSPLDRTFGQDPFAGGPSSPLSFTPETGIHSEVDADVKPELDDQSHSEGMEPKKEQEETPMREIDPDDLDDLDDQEPEDERQCRICFSGKEEEAALGTLISPCLCTGSVRVSRLSS